MALALSIDLDGRDYVRVEHVGRPGESFRIAVVPHARGNSKCVTLFLVADQDAPDGQEGPVCSPEPAWQFVRGRVLEAMAAKAFAKERREE